MGTIDLLVELDDRLPTGRSAGKARALRPSRGWLVGAYQPLWAPARGATLGRVRVPRPRPCPGVRAQSRRGADRLSRVRRRVPRRLGVPGSTRESLFVAERDAHEGLLRGYGVPRLPPDVRVSVADGDPRAGEVGGRAAGPAWGSLAGRRIIAVTWTMIPTMVSVFAPTLTSETWPKEDFRDPL